MQADAEHQQDDADLGELFGEREVTGEAGGVRSDDETGNEVTDNRRKPKALARRPKISAAISPNAMVVMRVMSCPRRFFATRGTRGQAV